MCDDVLCVVLCANYNCLLCAWIVSVSLVCLLTEILTNEMLLSETDLPFLFGSTKCAVSKWKEVGLNLGFQHFELAAIEESPLLMPEGSIGCFREMLNCWLKWAPPRNWPTFGTLAAAFQCCGYGHLVEKLRLNFVLQQGKFLAVSHACNNLDYIHFI